MSEIDVRHYGVKGMHWGHHKAVADTVADLSNAQQIKKDATKKNIAAEVKKAGGLHSVGDKQLETMLNRMNMEKRYKDFMNEEAKRRSAGYKAVGNILKNIAKVAVPIIVTGAVAKAGGPAVFRTVSEFQKSIGR